jgi:hypothetical protein
MGDWPADWKIDPVTGIPVVPGWVPLCLCVAMLPIGWLVLGPELDRARRRERESREKERNKSDDQVHNGSQNSNASLFH